MTTQTTTQPDVSLSAPPTLEPDPRSAPRATSGGDGPSAQATNFIADARTKLREQADQQAERAASSLGDVSHQLTSMADSAEGPLQDAVRSVARRVQQLADGLQNGGLDARLADAKRLARNRPGVFLLAAGGVGMVVGRLVKAGDTQGLVETAKEQMAPADDDGITGPPSNGDAVLGAGGTVPDIGTGGLA